MSDTDVYVMSLGVVFVCFCKEHYITGSKQAMINHLVEHQARGDRVPERTFEKLKEE